MQTLKDNTNEAITRYMVDTVIREHKALTRLTNYLKLNSSNRGANKGVGMQSTTEIDE